MKDKGQSHGKSVNYAKMIDIVKEERNMIRIALLDDEKAVMERSAEIIAQYADEHKEEIETKCYSTSEELKWDLEEEKIYYDIYLLDIELGEENGLEVAQFIRNIYPEPFIVFVTSYVKYSVKGYEYNVYRYILKEEMEEKLPIALGGMCEVIHNNARQIYIIETANTIAKINYRDIYYIYVEGKYTYFRTREGKNDSRIRKPLGEVYAELNAPEFVYLDKSRIVNVQHVMSVKQLDVRMRDEEILTVSRTQVKNLREQIKKYLGRNM